MRYWTWSCLVHSKNLTMNAILQYFWLWGNVTRRQNKSLSTELRPATPGPGVNFRALRPVPELPWMLIAAITAHGGREGEAGGVSIMFLLRARVVRHDFHIHCACAPGGSVISFGCWFSSSCVSIRVHCRIAICPHTTQTQCGSLWKIPSEP